ncbi:MAG: Deoxycytidine deaminase Dcd [Candidatus Methanohalarchaeum thermophilum]|uniref:Deoxycytidine deaminase Dcd n=1 Tax=Methanohalarchaeum thermophilum TaxID=1903181 RepID=A0A1Q6DU60_METT1|nr:MAG: Deoxycytidine deaminase Dcd [Candidatus Methanohalarchaeum thermophilum]
MSILSEEMIIEYLEEGELEIDPFSEESLQPASYDLRVSEDVEVGQHTLVSTLEKVNFPEDLAGIIRMRSTFSREGIYFSGGFVDPGFRGNLTLAVSAQDGEVKLKRNERIAQMIFLEVKGETKGYGGSYQGSSGLVDSKRT